MFLSKEEFDKIVARIDPRFPGNRKFKRGENRINEYPPVICAEKIVNHKNGIVLIYLKSIKDIEIYKKGFVSFSKNKKYVYDEIYQDGILYIARSDL